MAHKMAGGRVALSASLALLVSIACSDHATAGDDRGRPGHHGEGDTLAGAVLVVGNMNFVAGDGILRYDVAGNFIDNLIPIGTSALTGTCCMTFGPDEHLYVSDPFGARVLRFNGVTGEFIDEFVPPGSGGLVLPLWLLFHHGYLYVGDVGTGSVRRYDAFSGSPVDEFVKGAAQGMGMPSGNFNPQGFRFGPDGNLYVASEGTDRVLRYSGRTGDFIDEFVPANGDAHNPCGLVFGRDGYLYAGFSGTNEVRRFDVSKPPDQALVDTFVAPNSGGLTTPVGLTFGPDGNLYAASAGTGEILRYDGVSGAFLGAFVAAGTGDITGPRLIEFKAKTLVCHRSPGHHAMRKTLSIDYISAFDHLAHGDTVGACR